MRSYFSCGPFMDKVRKHLGIDKPKYAKFQEWDEWKETTRRAFPVAWFLTETLPDWLDTAWDWINSPYYDTRYYIRNRFIRKTHVLRTDCPPGQYWDTDSRILTAMANAVIDFVEIELAYKASWCVTEASRTAVWQNGRCAELGLDYLAQEQAMVYDEDDSFHKPELLGQKHQQALEADEILAIYNWAKNRPNRPDPYDASGWSDYCEACRKAAEAEGRSYLSSFFSENESTELKQMREQASIRLREIEQQYLDEDQDMLIRIVKIRQRLWS